MSSLPARRRSCVRASWRLGLPMAVVAALPIGAGPLAAPAAAPLSPLVAQSVVSVDQILARLDASDAITRRDAQIELARRGRSALPRLLKALVDSKMSARMRRGLIGALCDMTGISDDDVTGAPFAVILRAVGDPDPTLSAEAYRYFAKYIVAGAVDPVPSKSVIDVRVRAARVQDGDFKFNFAATGSTALRVTLTEIECHEDSSGGTTRWLFSVFAEGRSFVVPEQRYGDAGKPERYLMGSSGRSSVEQRVQQYGTGRGSADRFSLSVTAGKPGSSLRIVGYKPKHMQ